MDARELLKHEGDKTMLTERLEKHMKEYGFDRRIDEFIDEILEGKLADAIDVDPLFNQVYDFVAENLPSEIQEAFYYDVRSFIDKNGAIDEQ